ncbi:type IV pilus modification protein PilV [Chiayiivirga flava]|nr:type IV pilus modification protein PilV [Chiayiivirga flava]
MIPARHRPAARGFSLIEVMIAVLVLSIGLLGMAALQGMSLQNARSANYRSQATNLAYQLIDSMRGNRTSANLSGYLSGLDSWTPVCAGPAATPPSDCVGASVNPVVCDVARWQDRICRDLPNGRGRIVGAFATAPGTTSGTVTGDIVVQLCWADDLRNYDASADCSDDGETLFSTSTTL